MSFYLKWFFFSLTCEPNTSFWGASAICQVPISVDPPEDVASRTVNIIEWRLLNDVIHSGRQLYVGIHIDPEQNIFVCSIGLCQSYTQPTWEYVGLTIHKDERRSSRRMFRLTLPHVPCNGFHEEGPEDLPTIAFQIIFKLNIMIIIFPRNQYRLHNILFRRLLSPFF